MKLVSVAIGLIVFQGKILIGFRDHALHQGGCYEFPGGKVEPNESPESAVKREIYEEVGIEINVVRLFHELVHEYADRIVHLYFYVCTANSTQTINSGWQWVEYDLLQSMAFPAANKDILARLNWGRQIAITPSFDQLESKQIQQNIHHIYVRTEERYTQDAIEYLLQTIEQAQLILRKDQYERLIDDLKPRIFAIHLNSMQLHEHSNLDQFKNINVIAACHHAEDIKHANQIGCDAILLSPVNVTATHPEQKNILGWDEFASLSLHANMPVYALGGVKVSDLEIAQTNHAYGVAGIRDFWVGQYD